jgi:Flp pilus assembly pilin Flp
MNTCLKTFLIDEDGAVTVDWVVLAAGVITLALAATGVVVNGTEDLTSDADAKLRSQLISTSFN